MFSSGDEKANGSYVVLIWRCFEGNAIDEGEQEAATRALRVSMSLAIIIPPQLCIHLPVFRVCRLLILKGVSRM